MCGLVSTHSLLFFAVYDTIPVQSVPHELTTREREAVLAHLNGLSVLREEGMRSFELKVPGRPTLFVKYSDDILVEAGTQHFFYLRADGDESAPRIPKVLDAFSSEESDCVMVMEKIEAPMLSDCGISDEAAAELAAPAVKWLLNQLPWVPDTCYGRISSGLAPVWHQFFKDHQAPKPFTNSEELAGYVSKVWIPHLTSFMSSY
jgi:hypothetical protein